MYSVVSTTHLCGHKDTDKPPFRCYKQGFDEDGCRLQCSKHTFCVGFSQGGVLGDNCWLMVSQASCTTGWTPQTGKTASNGNDLVEGNFYAYDTTCFAKSSLGSF